MGKVFVTTYEIIGAGLLLAEAHYRQVDEAREAHFAFVERVGGRGFRPDYRGGILSVFFDELPKGWKKRDNPDGKVEAMPHKGNKIGLALYEQIAGLPCAPSASDLAEKFGYAPPEMAFDSERGVVYFTTDLRVAHPVDRFFLRIPRFGGDNFEPEPDLLKAVPESELMLAVETHNAEAQRLRLQDAVGEAGEVFGEAANV